MIKKIFYIVTLILGVIGTLLLIAGCVSIIYIMISHYVEEISGTPFIDNLLIIGGILLVVGAFILLTLSPSLMSWSWKKLKKINKIENIK